MPGRVRQITLLVLVLVTTTTVAAAPATGAEPSSDATIYSPSFADVPADHMFAGPIRAMFEAGVTRGCNEKATRFCPEAEVTRGQMAAFLVRALDLPEAEGIDFVDDDSSTFEKDIERLAAAGITLGCNPPDNDRFCPDRPVTRGQMAAFLVRALPIPEAGETGFVDDDLSIFEPAIERLASFGITKGCNPPDNDRFCPDSPITRGQMATFLTRALPLTVPPAIPEGVEFTRAMSGTGVALSVCREASAGILVRSVSAGSPLMADLTIYEPSFSAISSGELDSTTDEWRIPEGEGCATLDVSWDPRSNVLVAPLDTLKVNSSFGRRFHPIYRVYRLHAGTDFDAETGDPVYAAAGGLVVEAASRGGYGLMVEVRHPGGLATRYAHLRSMDVAIGDTVVPGEVVGLVGCTGACTGSHLHFETLEFGEPVDPMSYLGSLAS